MKLRLLSLNKYAESVEAFEEKARNLLAESEEALVDFRVFEHAHNSDIVFQFVFSGPKSSDEDICILAWATTEQIENLVNVTLEGMTANHIKAKHINIVATMKSQRTLAALIVERFEAAGPSESIKEDTIEEANRPKKQDSESNSKSKPRRQRKAVQGN